jgi:uncharacterized protein YjdB
VLSLLQKDNSLMATYKVAWKASTKEAKVLLNAAALGTGFSSIGTFDHDDDADDILGASHDENHAIYHHVQERLYHQDVYDMQSVTIYIPVGTITSLPATDTLDLSDSETVQITNTFAPTWAANTEVTYSVPDTYATLTVNPAGDDNGLIFTAVEAGEDGDDITVRYVDPAGNNQALGVVVSGSAITVNLATGAGGAITSTAAQVKAAIEGSVAADALVNVAIMTADTGSADDGSGVVTAMSVANLAGGAPVLSVDENGLVTPLAAGSATITVTAADGFGATDTVAITVQA